MKSQTEAVLKVLNNKGYITSFDAFNKYGVTRLSAIIYNLRHSGFNITTEKMSSKNRFGNVALMQSIY